MLKTFYKVNLQTNFFLVLLILVLLSTISSFLDKDISFGIFSLVVFLLGCIYYFFFPNILATMSYRRLLTKNNNQEMHIKVTVNEKEAYMTGYLKEQSSPTITIKGIQKSDGIYTEIVTPSEKSTISDDELYHVFAIMISPNDCDNMLPTLSFSCVE